MLRSEAVGEDLHPKQPWAEHPMPLQQYQGSPRWKKKSSSRVCYSHGGLACELCGGYIDIMLGGMSCRPVSAMREKRWTDDGGPESHEQVKVYIRTIDILHTRLVKCGALEDVLGFGMRRILGHGIAEESELDKFLQEMERRGRYSTRVVFQHNDTMLEFSRTRTRVFLG